jgi:23S rRNA (pseudouridine1915-N3)-methyltransferase
MAEALLAMRLCVIAVGKAPRGAERDLVERYFERARQLTRRIGFSTIDLVEVADSRLRTSDERRAGEAAELLRAVPEGAVIAALDSGGSSVSSEAFARSLAQWRDRGTSAAAFLIGGADGHGAAVLDRAQVKIAFGVATWPHLLVRAMLAEQIYRACTLLAGHPYHRA